MALIQVSMMAQTLGRTVPVTVILPTDKMVFPGQPVREDKPYKTLYLLHGVLGSCMDWVAGTRIQRFAEDNDLAVVMPSGDNMFYLDHPESGNYYAQFVGRELVEQTAVEQRPAPADHCHCASGAGDCFSCAFHPGAGNHRLCNGCAGLPSANLASAGNPAQPGPSAMPGQA